MRKTLREGDDDGKQQRYKRRRSVFTRKEGHLQVERILHGAQSPAHPLLGGGTIVPAIRPGGGGGKDAVVGVGESPDCGIGGRSGGNGTKLVSWVGVIE